MGKKKKHILQFAGSVEIGEVLSPNNTTFRFYIKVDTLPKGTSYNYNSLDQVSGDFQIELDPEVTVGSFVTVLDRSDDSRYHAAKVIDITGQNVTVHYYDTKSRQI